MKIAILIDTVKRDLSLATAIKLKMQASAIGSVDILPIFPVDGDGKFTYGKYFLNSFDFIITPSYNVSRTKSIRLRTLLAGARLIEFTSEQFYSSEFEKEKLNTDHKVQYTNHVYKNFVWSNYYANKLISAGVSDKDKIWIVGSPKVFAQTPSKQREGIAFVSDFSLADFNEQQINSFNKLYKCNLTKSDISSIAKERQAFIDYSKRLSKTSGKPVYIRPHPGEDKRPYEEAVSAGVIASWPEDESFTDFIKSKEHSIVHTSTTIFETCALGIPVHNIKYGEIPKSLQRDYYSDLITFESEDEITKKVTTSNSTNSELNRARMHHYFDNFSGAYQCSDAIISALLKINKTEKKTNKYLLKLNGLFSLLAIYPHIFISDTCKWGASVAVKNELFRKALALKFGDNLNRFFDPSHRLTKLSIETSINAESSQSQHKPVEFTSSQHGNKPIKS